MSIPRLEIDRLSRDFDGMQVLDGLSLTVGRGEFVSILGPSGAGKSTLFQILTGGLGATGGTIRFDGDLLEPKSRPFAFMPQNDALMPWRRMIDNASLGLEVQGVPRTVARERVRPLFQDFGLAGFDQHYPQQLSGGMRQRAALLRTVVQDRAMLLLDEPFGALDALTRTVMQRWLESMWEQHRWTALLVTHDVREAIFLSDRIYVLSARPARVLEEIRVPLAHPRTLADLAGPQAAAIHTRILDMLLNPSEPKRT